MKRHLFLTLSITLLTYSSFSQEYSYTHYDVKDGLAGSSAYCITQDKDGFIWIGTEAGVSRFDGTHFKNYTLEDGLPDIEVLQIFGDSKGRVWMAPFRKSICYYYKGKIYTENNDPSLRDVHIQGNIEGFAEDKYGNILAQESTALHLFPAAGKVREYTTINGRLIDSCDAVATSRDGNFLVQSGGNIYNLSKDSFTRYLRFTFPFDRSLFIALNSRILAWRDTSNQFRIMSLLTGKIIDLPHEKWHIKHVSFSVIGDSLAYRNEAMGSTEYNVFTGSVRKFSLGGQISRTFRDDDGNMWFTSLGQGIFRLNSNTIRNISLRSIRSAQCVAFSVEKVGNELLIGSNYSMIFRFKLPSFRDAGTSKVRSEAEDVRFVTKAKDKSLLLGTNVFFGGNLNKGLPKKYIPIATKFVTRLNDSLVLVGSHRGVFLVDAKKMILKDSLWHGRATAAYFRNDTTYVGTLNGLFMVRKDRSVENLGEKDAMLNKRISSIVRSGDGTLWIATYGDGIIGYKAGHRTAILTRKQGLSSDLCRVLALHDNILWIGTDKGLNKIDLADPEYTVTSYTASDGLGSDIINAICADGSMVYVGTPAGLSFFDDARTERTASCRLQLLSLLNSGKERLSDTNALRLPYTDNNIRFEFAGISYRSSGNITYKYRLLGLDSAWKKTKESFLEYPTLPSGDYKFQLQAVNKFGRESSLLSQRFFVAAPFWKTAWFDASALVVFLFFTWLAFSLRIKQIRRRQAQQDELNKKLTETEHMALQAQMNPHFIFNCLNSIQQYIFDQDIFAANKYITGFARLIRATLHNSSKPLISLADEVDYLTAYLSLEKLRFKEKMNYTVEVELSLRGEIEEIQIPPMLIQPYVENSMRHGLRHKTDGQGYIRINIIQEGDKLVFIIEDNGIGREQSARYKTREHIEYQSKGMSLTADRIRLINTVNQDSIQVEVLDLNDSQGSSTGTRVIVKFPRYDLLQKNSI